MIFKEINFDKDTDFPEKAILAHSQFLNGKTIDKGTLVNRDDLSLLKKSGLKIIPLAIPENGDVHENKAANIIGEAISGKGIVLKPPTRGRSNIYADQTGVLVIDEETLIRQNSIDENISISTLPNFTPVQKGQLVATAKIIPFFIGKKSLHALKQEKKCIQIKHYKKTRILLICTKSPNQKKSLFEKFKNATISRIKNLGLPSPEIREIHHNDLELLKCLKSVSSEKYDCILISSALATTDINDLIPATLKRAGGKITRFGLPVDPGNLTIIAEVNSIPVLGLPGCAKSKKLNGFDWVFERILIGQKITNKEFAKMGIGGLLKEMPDRPEPREPKNRRIKSKKIALILLAAGKSSRMGEKNKLTEKISNTPMVLKTAYQTKNLKFSQKIAVLGHQANTLKKLFEETDFIVTKNKSYSSGISSSIKAGLLALDKKTDATVILLGDMPMVKKETLEKLIGKFQSMDNNKILIPTWKGKRGNPVLIGNVFFEDIHKMEGDKGAQQLFSKFEEQIVLLEVNDGGVCLDIDTMEALKNFDDDLPHPSS